MTCPSPADQKRQKEITDLGDASLFLEILVQVLVTMLPRRQYFHDFLSDGRSPRCCGSRTHFIRHIAKRKERNERAKPSSGSHTWPGHGR